MLQWAAGAGAVVLVAVAAALRGTTRGPEIRVFNVSSLMARRPDAKLEHDLAKAAARLGVFRLVGHGVDVEAMLAASRSFFKLPEDVKLAAVSPHGSGGFSRGYIPVGGESGLASFFELKEGFCYGWPWERSNSTPSNPIAAPNTWPVLDPLRSEPEPTTLNVSLWQQTLLGYFADSISISTAVSRALASSMRASVTASDIDNLLAGGDTYSLMRLFHYLAADQLPSIARGKNRTGSSPHTDWHVLTVILQDTTGGLQVQDGRGHWLDVPAHAGELIVLVGDYMSALSGGRYHAPVHRVLLPPTGLERYSYTLFHYPRFDALVPHDASRRAAERQQRASRRRGGLAFNTLVPAGEELIHLSERAFGDLLEAKWRDVASNRAS